MVWYGYGVVPRLLAAPFLLFPSLLVQHILGDSFVLKFIFGIFGLQLVLWRIGTE